MTDKELRALDAACCQFAGLEPRIERQLIDRFEQPEIVLTYPPVSTSWEAAGRLMEDLEAVTVTVEKVIVEKVASWESTVEQGNRFIRVFADSGPLALALAVAELAKVSK